MESVRLGADSGRSNKWIRRSADRPVGDATLGFTLQAKGYAIYSFSTPLNVPFSETLGAALDFGLTCTVGGLYVGLSWQYPHAAQVNLPLGQPTLTALTMLGTTGTEGLVRLGARDSGYPVFWPERQRHFH